MKLDSLCSHPEILSNITFLMNNYKDASFHISINGALKQKNIRVVVGDKFCLEPSAKIRSEICDDLQIYIFEFPLQEAEFIHLLEMLDHTGICYWQRKYQAVRYPWVQWKVTIARKNCPPLKIEGTCAYPERWEEFLTVWNSFANLESILRFFRMRSALHGVKVN